MSGPLLFLAAGMLFLVGMRLSFFFSGNEIGFYRASFLRVSLEAEAGDPRAQRIRWFAARPADFVATTLVGNNIANYLVTLSFGALVSAFGFGGSGWGEVVGTLALAPVVFVFGELVPKNLYFRAPLALLRRDIRFFTACFYAMRPASWPLTWISAAFERLGGTADRQPHLLLGRTRLVQVLSEGHREGLLRDVQTRLAHGLLHTAPLPVLESTTPAARILGVAEDASVAQLLDFARRYGLNHVPVHRAGRPAEWFGYVRVVDAAVRGGDLARLAKPAPDVDSAATKLEALLALRQAGAVCGLVRNGSRLVGIVHLEGLVEQLFRPVTSVSQGHLA